MKSKLLGCVSAALLGAAIAGATLAMAGGFGGHGGGGFGGGGGFRGMPGGGMHFGGMPGGFHGGMVTGRSVFVPGGNRFAGAPFAGRHVFNHFNHFNHFALRNHHFFFQHHAFFFRHHHFRNFAFSGVPFAVGYNYGYDGCWRQAWTGYGYNWVNLCYNYGY